MTLATTTETLEARLSDLLKFEIDPLFCRDTVTLTAVAVDAGTVMGRITADGTYAAYDPDATNGLETAVAVALFDAEASAVTDVAARGVIVSSAHLIWDADTTAAEKAASIIKLAALGIVIKE